MEGAGGDLGGHADQAVEVDLELPLPLAAHRLGPRPEELPAGEGQGLHRHPVPGREGGGVGTGRRQLSRHKLRTLTTRSTTGSVREYSQRKLILDGIGLEDDCP